MRRLATAIVIAATICAGAVSCVKTSTTAVTTQPPAAEAFSAPFVEWMLFGYWLEEPFASDWVETREIPREPGLNFGWRIKLREPHTKYVNIIERMLAPSSVNNWGRLDQRHLVRSDRLVATVPNALKVRDGWIHRSNWAISEDDPLGDYQLEVQVNGRMAARVVFTLVPIGAELPPADVEEGVPQEEPDLEQEEPEGTDVGAP